MVKERLRTGKESRNIPPLSTEGRTGGVFEKGRCITWGWWFGMERRNHRVSQACFQPIPLSGPLFEKGLPAGRNRRGGNRIRRGGPEGLRGVSFGQSPPCFGGLLPSGRVQEPPSLCLWRPWWYCGQPQRRRGCSVRSPCCLERPQRYCV